MYIIYINKKIILIKDSNPKKINSKKNNSYLIYFKMCLKMFNNYFNLKTKKQKNKNKQTKNSV